MTARFRTATCLAGPPAAALSALLLGTATLTVPGTALAQAEAKACERTVTANVVALDNPIFFNRLGAQNVNWMMYALRRDVVGVSSGLPEASGGALSPGRVQLRADKRPRPLVLRVAAGECLQVNFENLLAPVANPNNGDGAERNEAGVVFNGPVNDNQVAGRFAGFHVQGMELVGSIDSDASFVGENANSLVAPGQSATYTYRAVADGSFLVTSYGATFGGEATGGNVGMGLFGQVNVQPPGAAVFRSQVTEEDMRLATTGTSASGHPIVDYDATYPDQEPWISEGRAGLPVLAMTTPDGEIVHSDIDAVVAYRDPASGELGSFPAETYPLESVGLRNPTLPNRLEPYREFASIWHDEIAATQAFPAWFNDPVLSHTLGGVRDAFMINYGSGGIGSEIIANRLGVGPMHDCLSCAYEDFFLSSYTVGDPAQLVDIPANLGLEACDPALNNCLDVGPKANFGLYPDDPANVHHSYIGDFVKFRNVHAGPKEQHIFHLHNHQWLFNANDDNANYLDAQGLGPGSSYTYEIVFGGGGNRNKSAGDAIFHCHFYPHFAQGMWYMWRIHDTLETGTALAVSDTGSRFHDDPFELFNGTPANNQGIVDAGDPNQALGAGFETTTRALPDAEVLVGMPTPALVPLPGKAMAPLPGKVTVVTKDSNGDGIPDSSQAKVDRTDRVASGPLAGEIRNPGYPFWIGGIEDIVGQRAPTPPLDMYAPAGGWDGGLPRGVVDGYLAGGVSEDIQTRLDLSKTELVAKPVYFPETGTEVERAAMAFHAQRCHDTAMPGGASAACDSSAAGLNDSGQPNRGGFITNGAPPVPGAPFSEPCIDDEGDLLTAGVTGDFFDAKGGLGIKGRSQFNTDTPRVYKAAVIQTDVTFNKVGYHYPQQRIITLWEDVAPTLAKTRAPEPFVIRLNTYDCAHFQHTNLVPKEFELDDYQVKTPTDIISQHMHLPKWDLVSTDGAGNGWNYESGTFSSEMVVSRIKAINAFNADPANTPVLTDVEGNPVVNSAGDTIGAELKPLPHPFFGAEGTGLGARTTISRWFSDPVVNAQGVNRGLGVSFTHDHYGPSTHQQVGLYATLISEPADSTWVHNETGELLFDPATRNDGGPTSWQAAILTGDTDGDGEDDSFREFYLEFGDFQHAYEKGVFVGVGPDGHTVAPPTETTFINAINPSVRQEVQGQPRNDPPFPDVGFHPPFCPGGVPRPCPEAISVDDIGMFVVNYRAEPVGLRVFDPDKTGPDGRPGTQADGLAGDLAFALQTRTDRAIPELNTVLGDTPYPPLNQALRDGDAFTPMLRSFSGDTVRVRIQAGAHEHEHNATIHGVKWLQGGSGHGEALNSGWRNAQNIGISEQFTLTTPVVADFTQFQPAADYAYSVSAAHDGWWSGVWGVMRNYKQLRDDLFALPDTHPVVNAVSAPDLRGLARAVENARNANQRVAALQGLRNAVENVVRNRAENFNQFRHGGLCPADAPEREFDVSAVLANDVLENRLGLTIPRNAGRDSDGDGIGDNEGGRLDPNGGTLVYNPRPTVIDQIEAVDEETGETLTIGGNDGPLHDPTAMMYVHTGDLRPAPTNFREFFACRFFGGVENPRCPVKLKADAPVEPIVMRAAAGDCIRVTLRNRLPRVAPDLAGFNTLLQVVNRDRDPVQGLTWFHNNLVRPSSHVGLHPQLVEYDVTRSDGANVGINRGGVLDPFQTAAPGIPIPERYTWYAGNIEFVEKPGGRFAMKATPVEFGATNLVPADRIKQGQKGLVGSLIIEPEGSKWAENDRRRDHQVDDPAATRRTRTMATVKTADGGEFRDLVAMFRKGQNHRFADGTPVQNIAGEGGAVPEDSHDAGQQSINYATEPMWYRFGLPPATPFGNAGGGLGAVANPELAYSNQLVGEDPVTPVFTAAAGEQVRMRVLMPTGAGRGTTFNLHGHLWQRDPYICPGSADLGLKGKCAPGELGSRAIGDNPLGYHLGGQESVTPFAHFDVVVPAGGRGGVPGDYLFRDHASFGNTSGLWGILRVTQ